MYDSGQARACLLFADGAKLTRVEVELLPDLPAELPPSPPMVSRSAGSKEAAAGAIPSLEVSPRSLIASSAIHASTVASQSNGRLPSQSATPAGRAVGGMCACREVGSSPATLESRKSFCWKLSRLRKGARSERTAEIHEGGCRT